MFYSETDIINFVYTVLKIHIAVSSLTRSCGKIRGYQCFGSKMTSILKMETVYSSVTRMSTYKTSQCHNPEVHNGHRKLSCYHGN
jgi:hypothetical protein